MKTNLTPAEIRQLLSEVELFSALNDEQLSMLANGSRVRELRAKEILFVEGEVADTGYVVVDGRMALLKSSSSGKELIFELLPAGEAIGLPVVINRRPYPVTARAQVATSLIAIPSSVLYALVEVCPSLLKGMMEIMAQRIEQSQRLARSLAHDKVEVRVASALLALVPRFGKNREESVIDISMTRQELADITGITLETASRVARGMESSGIIDLSDITKVKILDSQRLVDVASV